MSDETSKTLADRLIEAERAGSTGEPPSEPSADPWFERMLESERRFEERIRRLALLSWAVTFVCMVLFAISFFIVRNLGGTLVEVTRAALLVVVLTGVLSLLSAAVTSITWLFRSRTPTLRAIDRRLAALEKLLTEK